MPVTLTASTASSFYGPDEAGTLEASRNAADIRLDTLSAEEQKALHDKATALQKLLNDPDIAKYKVEILFERHKTTRGGVFPGVMTVWKSGSVLSGGGDEIMYPCPRPQCKGYICSDQIAPVSQTAFCIECKSIWKLSDLRELRLFVLDVPKWCYVIAREVLRTECRASIYMRNAWGDLQKSTRTQRSGEDLANARGNREYVIYELARLITDLNAGASLEACIRALIVG